MSLDLPAPVHGWGPLLASRGIEVVTDDLGRPAVPRAALGELSAEREEARAAQRAERERQHKQAAQKVRVPAGMPAKEGLSALETMMAAEDYQAPSDELGGIPRPRFLEEEFEASQRGIARRKAEAEAREKARAADRMKKDLS